MKSNLETLLDPSFIRRQSQRIFELTLEGKTHFLYNEDKFESLCTFVLEVIEKNYPNWDIPYHGRLNHLNTGKKRTSSLEPKSLIDLIFVSVLLDAGAGPHWSFIEQGTKYSRSEGLAVASYSLFTSGLITKEDGSLDQDKISNLSQEDFEKVFQVTTKNPLQGVEGRLDLIKKLGKVKRPGLLLDEMSKEFDAKELLLKVLKEYHSIWPLRTQVENINLADAWEYNFPEGKEIVPFHKLSQWLTYSLIEIFENQKFKVKNLDGMTGLPEYRNGGLLIDSGLLSLQNVEDLEKTHNVDSDLIIEWRALTIVILDKIAERIRQIKNQNTDSLPLVKILEGGTWHAGRKLAQEKRGGTPPLKLNLTGTVF